jgi:hypothetical protein
MRNGKNVEYIAMTEEHIGRGETESLALREVFGGMTPAEIPEAGTVQVRTIRVRGVEEVNDGEGNIIAEEKLRDTVSELDVESVQRLLDAYQTLQDEANSLLASFRASGESQRRSYEPTRTCQDCGAGLEQVEETPDGTDGRFFLYECPGCGFRATERWEHEWTEWMAD